MKTTAKAFGIALAAMAVFNGACAENESAYVTGDGVDCELTSSALTVKSGDATLVAATPSGVLHVWIMAGASLKLAAGASPFATPPVLHVFGTLDRRSMLCVSTTSRMTR